MFTTRRALAAMLLAACTLGVGIFTFHVPAAAQTEEKQPAKATNGLPALLKARFEAAQKEFKARHQEMEGGGGALHFTEDAAHHLLTAQVEMSDKKADQIAAYEAHLGRMKDMEAMYKVKYEAGRATAAELHLAQYHRLEAEIWLARAKGK